MKTIYDSYLDFFIMLVMVIILFNIFNIYVTVENARAFKDYAISVVEQSEIIDDNTCRLLDSALCRDCTYRITTWGNNEISRHIIDINYPIHLPFFNNSINGAVRGFSNDFAN